MTSLSKVFVSWLLSPKRSSKGSRSRNRRSAAPTNQSAQIEMLETRSLMSGVSVAMAVTSDWGTGFQTQMQLTNTQATAVPNWKLEFDYAPNITSIWDAQIVSHTGNHYVIQGLSWDQNLPAQGNLTFGFVASGSSAANPTNYLLNGAALGTTVSLPTLSIANSSVTESASQSVNDPFVVSLSAAATTPVTVAYSTSNGTAVAGVNYQAASGTLTFAPGQTQATINVSVLSNPAAAATTTFNLALSNPSGATLSGTQATGTIQNTAASAGGGFQFSVTSDWGTGFGGQIIATNTGSTAITNWQLGFDFPGQISSIWNATITSHVGNHYVIQNAGWNSTILPGANVTIGFDGSPGNVTVGPTNYAWVGTQSGGGGGGGTVNQAPTPANDSVSVIVNQPTIINVLANDTDPNGYTLTVTAVTAPQHGAAVLNTDGTITYTPTTSYVGGDSFTYTVSNGHGGTATANVAVTVAQATTSANWPTSFYAPYVDMTLYPTYNLVTAATTGNIKYFSLAFIVADSNNQPSWGGYTQYEVNGGSFDMALRQQITNLRAAGGDVMVSFGGASNSELAQQITNVTQLTAAYQTVVNAYNVTHLDFDIEGAASADHASIDRRSQALAALEQNAAAAGKNLQIWFTLPVLPTGLTADGLYVVQSALKYGVQISGINVMAMDFGDSAAPSPANQMGNYAIESANSLYSQLSTLYGTSKTSAELWGMIGVTPMIGLNDVTTETFDLNAAKQLLAFAEQKGMGRISIWSLNRDTASTAAKSYVDTTSSSVVQTQWEFSSLFETF